MCIGGGQPQRLGGDIISLPLLTPIKEGIKCFRLMLVPFLLQQHLVRQQDCDVSLTDFSFLVGREVQKSLVQEEGLMSSPNKRNHGKTAVYNLLFKSFLLILLRQLGPTTTLPSL